MSEHLLICLSRRESGGKNPRYSFDGVQNPCFSPSLADYRVRPRVANQRGGGRLLGDSLEGALQPQLAQEVLYFWGTSQRRVVVHSYNCAIRLGSRRGNLPS